MSVCVYVYIYIYIYMCVCVCARSLENTLIFTTNMWWQNVLPKIGAYPKETIYETPLSVGP